MESAQIGDRVVVESEHLGQIARQVRSHFVELRGHACLQGAYTPEAHRPLAGAGCALTMQV